MPTRRSPSKAAYLRLDLLHGDRLPRLPRHRRHHLPDRLPDPRLQGRLHAAGSISASRRRPGTGISSTSSGCSCSPRSTSGAAGARRSTAERSGRERAARRCGRACAAIARAAARRPCSTAGSRFAPRCRALRARLRQLQRRRRPGGLPDPDRRRDRRRSARSPSSWRVEPPCWVHLVWIPVGAALTIGGLRARQGAGCSPRNIGTARAKGGSTE